MESEEPEIGRFQPKGDKGEPLEPFDDTLAYGHEPLKPMVEGLHLPKAPLTKEKFTAFLVELAPLVEAIESLSRKDQHQIGVKLKAMKELLEQEKPGSSVAQIFEKIFTGYNQLLVHSTPEDHEKVLKAIEELRSKL